ncbi:hypothetical protein [Allopusillimonas ginsengisoli]|uniref:hypothetical protein n=1 Tax=Allopusillimonas ginsengisoli TaxID=453575 RepID=UPI00101F3901|nr:hypothetical protein [Allopusillimonas ginsengisoli]TEA79486.1 hypothetical protein ERE07_00550 [Allopusillimonas ginsengisoli]
MNQYDDFLHEAPPFQSILAWGYLKALDEENQVIWLSVGRVKAFTTNLLAREVTVITDSNEKFAVARVPNIGSQTEHEQLLNKELISIFKLLNPESEEQGDRRG